MLIELSGVGWVKILVYLFFEKSNEKLLDINFATKFMICNKYSDSFINFL